MGENDQFQLIASEKYVEEIYIFLSVLQGNETGIDIAPLNILKETMYIEMDSLEHEYDLNIYLHQAYVLRFKNHPLIDTEVLVQMLMQNSRAFEGEALPIDLPGHFIEEGISNWIFLKIAGSDVHLANAAAHGYPCYSVRHCIRSIFGRVTKISEGQCDVISCWYQPGCFVMSMLSEGARF
ncbi:hypothetical protein [Bacillus sp. MSP13]|uniref:hypothetical protein n=1 Tax=Bacillus sp. MSP13 TaxID=1071061 RepID=UPI0012E021DB|nr:hypothetical protein [Bacillus sp. MSP13]